MNFLKNYKSIFNEAIPLSKVRPYIKGEVKNYKDRLKDWFDGKWRVYLKLQNKTISNKIENALENEIKNALKDSNFELLDYHKGIAFDKKNKREIKLGKVLGKIDKKLLDQFNSDKERESKNFKNLLIAISRHPYDILGQSYDRGWTNCKELGKGVNRVYLRDEIYLVLVAYLIQEDDKNIKKPIARVLIIPYMNDKSEIGYIVQNVIYGTSGNWGDDFVKEVKKWVISKQGKLTGKFTINSFVYRDQMPTTVNYFDDEELPDWVGKNKPIDYENRDFFGTKIFIWKDGTWEDGTFKGGGWTGGTFKDGIWEDGEFTGGTFKGGTWKDGTFSDGIWEKGIWISGRVYSKKFKRNFNSSVNPNKFYELEKESKTAKELQDKVK